MKHAHSSKLKGIGIASLALLAMTGCMGTKYLSQGISDDGHVQQKDIVFPDIEDAWQHQGQFANSENLSKIRPGVAKDELYQLIGRPHFSEAQYAREWDYIMKFYMPDDSVKICQYKVIFDKDYRGQEFYWKPADCPPQQAETVAAAPERINLSADALFAFDKWQTQDMLPQGRNELDALAAKLSEYQQMGKAQIIITGHTDHLGDDMYNMNLSQLRAQTVRSYLASRGINPDAMLAVGAGETQPVTQCSTGLSREQEINCLQPNRRVTLDVTVIQQ
ncbi:OmpA family protein [Psychrobacter sp. FDAARGOS_221]|uniref:OmpA family protein n=1 Tax=Psychrobacter sp. FDAARGOS_221 TaxID=1975705 RepID=UPI000BB537A7|nr:OmpA family protein [Psychrobacter sp. FDAARGOS_221]PNK60987.1 outer membrane protein assembly factor BamE [Psychrobacter sp. FDAARGOS_221]